MVEHSPQILASEENATTTTILTTNAGSNIAITAHSKQNIDHLYPPKIPAPLSAVVVQPSLEVEYEVLEVG